MAGIWDFVEITGPQYRIKDAPGFLRHVGRGMRPRDNHHAYEAALRQLADDMEGGIVPYKAVAVARKEAERQNTAVDWPEECRRLRDIINSAGFHEAASLRAENERLKKELKGAKDAGTTMSYKIDELMTLLRRIRERLDEQGV